MRVIRSAGQNVSPSDDGRLFDQAFSDGLFEDATIAANGGNSIAIGALYGIICGRDFTAEAQTIAATLPQSDTATGYVYVEIDTSSDDIITIGTALAPFTPTYEDINVNGAVVQMIIAQYEASAVAVTSVTPTYTTASAGAVDAGSVATIETSPTVAAHAVGDIILYGGKIYEVTAAISIGESLVIGTNIVATSIGDEISALNAGLTPQKVSVTSMISGLSITDDESYVIGKLAVINVRLKSTSTISLSGQRFIKNMPLGLTQLADGNTYNVGILRVGSDTYSFGIANESATAVAIGAAGVTALASIPANTNIWISCQYVVADN